MSQVTSPDCENPYRSPQAEIPSTVDRRDAPGFLRCLFVGIAVAGLGAAACTVVFLPVVLAVRGDTALLTLFLGSVFFAVVTSVATKQRMARRTTCLRYAVAWGLRYTTIGAVLGLIIKTLFGGFISDFPVAAYFGSVIGVFFGSLGGAIQAWLSSRHDGSDSEPATHPSLKGPRVN